MSGVDKEAKVHFYNTFAVVVNEKVARKKAIKEAIAAIQKGRVLLEVLPEIKKHFEGEIQEVLKEGFTFTQLKETGELCAEFKELCANVGKVGDTLAHELEAFAIELIDKNKDTFIENFRANLRGELQRQIDSVLPAFLVVKSNEVAINPKINNVDKKLAQSLCDKYGKILIDINNFKLDTKASMKLVMKEYYTKPDMNGVVEKDTTQEDMDKFPDTPTLQSVLIQHHSNYFRIHASIIFLTLRIRKDVCKYYHDLVVTMQTSIKGIKTGRAKELQGVKDYIEVSVKDLEGKELSNNNQEDEYVVLSTGIRIIKNLRENLQVILDSIQNSWGGGSSALGFWLRGQLQTYEQAQLVAAKYYSLSPKSPKAELQSSPGASSGTKFEFKSEVVLVKTQGFRQSLLVQ